MLLLAASLSSLSGGCAPWIAGSLFLLLHSPQHSCWGLSLALCSSSSGFSGSLSTAAAPLSFMSCADKPQPDPRGDTPSSSPTAILMPKCVIGAHLSDPFPLKMQSASSACPALAFHPNRPSIHSMPNWQAAHFPGTWPPWLSMLTDFF